MFNFFSAIMAFFFSITSFFTVLSGSNLCTVMMVYNEDRGYVWECNIADESIAEVKSERARGSDQTFVIEGISEGRTEITMTNKRGETEECIIESIGEYNPYNGKLEFYYIYVIYNFGTYISYDEGITLTAETPVDGGYWGFGFGPDEPELASEPKTVNGTCTFDVINPFMEDVKYGSVFTYYDQNGTPLENKFLAYTLKKDGTIEYIDESRLTKIELPSDLSKLIFWTVADDYEESDAAEIISIYSTSDSYGTFYYPDDFSSGATKELIDSLLEEVIGKVPVNGTDTVVIEALKEGSAEFTLEKVDMYPLVKTENGYEIDTERYEVLETITIVVTVDADLNLTYEIR